MNDNKQVVLLVLVLLFVVTAVFAVYDWIIFDGYTAHLGRAEFRVYEDHSYVITDHFGYVVTGCLPFGLCQD